MTQIFIGNPPYSSSQDSANDNNKNIVHDHLHDRIRATYGSAELNPSKNKQSLYNSYLKALRLSSDSIIESGEGIMTWIIPSNFLKTRTGVGIRRSLVREFNKLYFFDLKGAQRGSQEFLKRQRGNVFGPAVTRAPIVIVIGVKRSGSDHPPCESLYYEIPDYLSWRDKRVFLRGLKSMSKIRNFKKIELDKNGDFFDQSSSLYDQFLPLAYGGKSDELQIFTKRCNGLVSNGEGWLINSSYEKVLKSSKLIISEHNKTIEFIKTNRTPISTDQFHRVMPRPPQHMKWSRPLINSACKGQFLTHKKSCIKQMIYKFFTYRWVYADPAIVKSNKVFDLYPPDQEDNMVILTAAPKSDGSWHVFISKTPHCADNLDIGYPLYYQDKNNIIKEGVSSEALEWIRGVYATPSIDKKQIFQYVYGCLHSDEFIDRFENDLKKGLIRVPIVPLYKDFNLMSMIGSELIKIHLSYDDLNDDNFKFLDKIGVVVSQKNLRGESDDDFYRTEGIERHPAMKSHTLVFNDKIAFKNIPPQVFEYRLNRMVAIDWLIYYQKTRLNKSSSGIKSDPNDYSKDPKYLFKLTAAVIALCYQTMELKKRIPIIDYKRCIKPPAVGVRNDYR